VSLTTLIADFAGSEAAANAPSDSEPSQHGDAVDRAYASLSACVDDWSRIDAAARLVLAIFDDFYAKLCEYPFRAMCAFETMDPQASIRISKERLGLYSQYTARHGPKIRAALTCMTRSCSSGSMSSASTAPKYSFCEYNG